MNRFRGLLLLRQVIPTSTPPPPVCFSAHFTCSSGSRLTMCVVREAPVRNSTLWNASICSSVVMYRPFFEPRVGGDWKANSLVVYVRVLRLCNPGVGTKLRHVVCAVGCEKQIRSARYEPLSFQTHVTCWFLLVFGPKMQSFFYGKLFRVTAAAWKLSCFKIGLGHIRLKLSVDCGLLANPCRRRRTHAPRVAFKSRKLMEGRRRQRQLGLL